MSVNNLLKVMTRERSWTPGMTRTRDLRVTETETLPLRTRHRANMQIFKNAEMHQYSIAIA